MAGITGCGEARLLVIRIGGVVVVGHVTSGAESAGQLVVSVDVALRTRSGHVFPGESEAGGGVIELSTSPGICVMAVLTSGGDSGLLVIGVGRALIILQVARHARRIGDVVIAVDVALRAGGLRVLPNQRETSL